MIVPDTMALMTSMSGVMTEPPGSPCLPARGRVTPAPVGSKRGVGGPNEAALISLIDKHSVRQTGG